MNVLYENVTLVTSFINIGRVPKGSAGNERDSSTYLPWAKAWSKINNPVDFYCDDEHFFNYFMEIRGTLRTRGVLVKTTDLWSFR